MSTPVKMLSPSGQPFDIHPDEVAGMLKADFNLVDEPKQEPRPEPKPEEPQEVEPPKRKPGRPRKSEG